MNVKKLGLLLATTSLLALAGCASPTVVTLQNGTQYLTRDMPKTHSADGFYEFQDISGKTIRVKSDDVATVRKEK
ncbi:YgdI/YgdR family lipoprotein [Pseudomonas sp. NFXW11]|uniref:YgdI/YgdR family lipoprotein n=1 Tax=Pseudomonas sp. NFXW11 TaxID=2819531 RepID=UPI003CE879C6